MRLHPRICRRATLSASIAIIDDGLRVSGPITEPGREPYIAVSRRLATTAGGVAGVVVGTLRLTYFRELFQKIRLSPGGALTLVHAVGALIARIPESYEVGQDLRRSQIFQRALTAPAGTFEGTAAIDGVRRLYVYRKVADYPLLISVGTAVDDIYAGWRTEAWRIGLLMLALCGLTIALTMLWIKEWRRRAQTQSELALLATTDPLTGLCNRRSFDEVVSAECHRSRRAQSSVGLLVIDVDHFKSYNDTFGHQAGDAILCKIAGCISSCINSAMDLAARYGGDEFAVFLNRSTVQQACDLAETICSRVAQLQDGSPITLSIGVAGATPDRRLLPRDLMTAADAALYEAKRNGRNQVSGGAQQQRAPPRLAVPTRTPLKPPATSWSPDLFPPRPPPGRC